jgi:cell wall-associated NlpC family hydrolase
MLVLASLQTSQSQKLQVSDSSKQDSTHLLKSDSAFSKKPIPGLADSIIHFAEQYLGNRYRKAGTGKGGFDCSGFVCHVMLHYGYRLPHSSAAQYLLGISVTKNHARKGDLIFFKGRNYRAKRVGHVGIVMSNNNGVITFIHSSVQGGVMVNKNTDLYYKKRFVGTRRILKP